MKKNTYTYTLLVVLLLLALPMFSQTPPPPSPQGPPQAPIDGAIVLLAIAGTYLGVRKSNKK